MDRVILYVDDATHALEQIARLREQGLRPDHWVLAACAPRMSSRISKWVSHSARENWRSRWFARTQQTLEPVLRQQGAQVTTVLAQGSLLELTQQLLLAHGAARVLDLRRPRVGAALDPVQAAQPRTGAARGPLPGSALGLGALLILAHGMVE